MNHRKAVIGLPPQIMIGILLVLLFAVICGALIRASGQRANDVFGYGKSAMSSWDFGCNNGGQVASLAELTDTMKKIYSDCKDKDICKCTKVSISSPSCLTVNKDVLVTYGLSDFYGSTNNAWGARIMCCETDHSPEAEIDVFNPKTCKVPIPEQCSKWTNTDIEPFFKVKPTSAVSIKAIKNGWIWKTTDLSITVKDDGNYHSC